MPVKVKKAGAAKAKPAAAKEKSTSTRRTAEDVAALVPAFVKHLTSGGKMRELKAEHGFSDDGPIRAALYRAGYDSKGVKHNVSPDSINADNAAGKKQVVSLRSEGEPWYALAFQTGKTEGELKKLVEEAGGPTGRVYREPAPKEVKAKKTAVKAKAKAAAADPS